MVFRYFDTEGKQLTFEQLRLMQISTPAMDHVFATVLERMENSGKKERLIEKGILK